MKLHRVVRRWMVVILILSILMVGSEGQATADNPAISIVTDPSPGMPVMHGLEKLTSALALKGITFEKAESLESAHGKTIVVAGTDHGQGTAARILDSGGRKVPGVPEAVTIWKTNLKDQWVVVVGGSDDRGLMYGLLELADRIRWSAAGSEFLTGVREVTERPDVSDRAVSIYTMNRAYWESRFYDESYWEQYLDMLAQHRFNRLTLIFGYENGGFLAPPYPYFFDVAGYPGIKMEGLAREQQEQNLDALNRLIQMAHARGIQVTAGIWDHIYRGGVQGGGIPGKQNTPSKPEEGLVWGLNAENLIPYTKAALAEFIRRVPGLDGIQFRMHGESGLKKEEQLGFWTDVFRMMKETAPDLRLDLRAKNLPDAVIQSALEIGVNFRITTKYWMEQMGMPFHPTRINPEKSSIRHSYAYLLRYPQQYKLYWRLWNGGTTRILLWGDPDYVRRFVESTHLYGGDGFEVNEPLATKMEAQPHDTVPFDLLQPSYRYYGYEFERYWHFFQLFGRIGYNPETSPEVWEREFELRFGREAGPLVEEALHKASWILPRIIASVYPYSKFPTTRGWAEKQRLGDLPDYATNQGSDLMQFANFDEEALLLTEGGETAKILPSANSVWFATTASEIGDLVAEAEKVIGDHRSKEFISTMTDLRILSNLALYHSRRIPAAVSYRVFVRTGDPSVLEDAIAYEGEAIEAWSRLVESAGDVYAWNLMMGVAGADLCGHWKDELAALQEGYTALQQNLNELADGPVGVKEGPRFQAADKGLFDDLFQIDHLPVTRHPVDEPVVISVQATSPAGIKWVQLRYRSVNQELDYKLLPMLPDTGKDMYRAVIPVEEIDPGYDLMYLIELMEMEGHGRIYPDLNKETPYIIIKLIR